VHWAPSISFAVLGGLRASRLSGALCAPTHVGAGLLTGPARDAWARSAALGSVAWWGAALLLATCVGLLASGWSPLPRGASAP
jgi:hypothetical protein